MRKKLLAVILGAVVLIGGITAYAKANSVEKTSDGRTVVKVGVSNDITPPFWYADSDNNPVGYDIDYLNALETKLPQYKFVYEWGDEEAQLLATDTGKYAFTLGFFFKTPERAEKFLYPENAFGYSVTALVTQTDRDDIKTLDDMVGKKFPPVSASGGLRSILNNYNAQHPDSQLTLESIDKPSTSDNLKAVAEGSADAIFLNAVTFDNVNKKLNLPLKIAGVVSKEPVYLVFNKNQTKLQQDIDKATAELVADGTLSGLSQKWFNVDFFKDIEYLNQAYQYNQSK